MPWMDPTIAERVEVMRELIEGLSERCRVLDRCVRDLLNSPDDQTVRTVAARETGGEIRGPKSGHRI